MDSQPDATAITPVYFALPSGEYQEHIVNRDARTHTWCGYQWRFSDSTAGWRDWLPLPPSNPTAVIVQCTDCQRIDAASE